MVSDSPYEPWHYVNVKASTYKEVQYLAYLLGIPRYQVVERAIRMLGKQTEGEKHPVPKPSWLMEDKTEKYEEGPKHQ